jgi:D-threonine aldolase
VNLETLSSLPQARVGMSLVDVPTPSLLLDLDAFEQNLRLASVLVAAHGVALRPHAKAHRCAEIAHRQIAAGARGICCQKLGEAFALARNGIRDIHLSNEIVGARSALLAAQLARHVKLSVCVDHRGSVRQLATALRSVGAHIEVLVEVDIGQHRCGVRSVCDLLGFVDEISSHREMTFAGIQAFHGGIQHIRGWEERREASRSAVFSTSQFIAALDRRGIRGVTVTGSGTGSMEFDVESGVFTEIQAGSYILMDRQYGDLEWRQFKPQHALHIGSTVMSTPSTERIICDAGLKSLAVDAGLPRPRSIGTDIKFEHWDYITANDEHGILGYNPRGEVDAVPQWGDQLLLIPGHVDPTVNLHNEYLCHRGAAVLEKWQVDARGCSW